MGIQNMNIHGLIEYSYITAYSIEANYNHYCITRHALIIMIYECYIILHVGTTMIIIYCDLTTLFTLFVSRFVRISTVFQNTSDSDRRNSFCFCPAKNMRCVLTSTQYRYTQHDVPYVSYYTYT